MNAKKVMTLIGISLLILISITAIVWVIVTRERPQSPDYAILLDYSDSRTINCGGLDAILQEILSSPNLMTNSTLYFFSTGDDKSSDEPILMGKYKIPMNVKVLEGQSKTQSEIQKFINKIKTRCEQESIKKRSPILLGIKRVIENLKTNGCDIKTGCKVFVQTDGQELSETTVKQSLNPKINSNSKTQISISNDGINIKICGFAQVSETNKSQNRHNIQTSEKTIEIWRQIFNNPNLLIFQPHCS